LDNFPMWNTRESRPGKVSMNDSNRKLVSGLEDPAVLSSIVV
jgi:hypothetical protein